MQKEEMVHNILFYPPFSDNESLTDHYYRMLWYLNPILDKIDKIILPHNMENVKINQIPYYLDKEILKFESGFNSKTEFVYSEEIEMEQYFADSSVVLIWNSDCLNGEDPNNKLISQARKNKKLYRIDHIREQYASSFYLKLSMELGQDKDSMIDECNKKFLEMSKKLKGDKCYIFGTGPSLGEYTKFDFDDGICLACNSMVKNKQLMDKLKPQLITVADPIFHAGCSNYAGEFRKYLVSAINLYGCYLIVPMRDYMIYINNLPDYLAQRIIGVPFVNEDKPNLNIIDEFSVSSTGNILTLLLIPLAATFFKDVYIMGCDGRPLEQKDYFWTHDPKSQLNEFMEDIKTAHPGFFSINYNDYYLKHIRVLEKWLMEGEKQGIRFTNLTPSYIPALSLRMQFNRKRKHCKPKVSIIMPAYNCGEFIIDSIQSIQLQSYNRWELIVVDDGSSDHTKAVAERYSKLDPRIRIIKNESKGVSSARNTGIRNAKGEYLTFLDADDTMLPGALKNRVEALDKNEDWNAVYCETQFVDKDLKALGWQLGKRVKITFNDVSTNPVHINSIMLRTASIGKVRFDDQLSNGEDWLFVSDILRREDAVYKVEDCFVTYRIHRSSTVYKDLLNHENSLIKIINTIYGPRDHLDNVKEKCRNGLHYPPKELVILRRRIYALTWALLLKDLDGIREILKEIASLDSGILSNADIRTQINTAVFKLYLYDEAELQNHIKKDILDIHVLLETTGIEKYFPHYSRILSRMLNSYIQYGYRVTLFGLSDVIKDKSYLLYGTGSMSENLTEVLESLGGTICFYSDSNPEKWDGKFKGKSIIPPHEIYKYRCMFSKIVIASSYVDEIKEKLVKMGFNENEDILIKDI